jgi:preprotein translocase subunit Sec61beta
MRKYIHTQQTPSARACATLLKAASALALLAILSALPASAQNGTPGGRSAQAVLHIRINIVPVVQLPRAQEKQQAGIVSYNLPVDRPTVDVIENVRVLPRSVVGSGAAVGSVVLKTLTIVTK